MQAAAQLQSRARGRVGDLAGAPDCSGRSVEGRQETIASGDHLPAPEVAQFTPDQGVMPVQEVTPAAVPGPGGALGRADDVGEQNRGQHPVRLRSPAGPGQELLYLIQGSILVPDVDKVVTAGQLHILRLRDVGGQIPAVADLTVRIAGPVQHQGGDAQAARGLPCEL